MESPDSYLSTVPLYTGFHLDLPVCNYLRGALGVLEALSLDEADSVFLEDGGGELLLLIPVVVDDEG